MYMRKIDHKFQTVFKLIMKYFIMLIETSLQLKTIKKKPKHISGTVKNCLLVEFGQISLTDKCI